MADGVITSKRSSLNTILALLKLRLNDYLGVASQRIMIVARHQRSLPNLVGDQDFILRVLGFRPVLGLQDRHDYRVYQRVAVIIRSRFEVDEADTDEFALTTPLSYPDTNTDPIGGSIVFKEQVLDALLNYIPEDGAGNAYTFEGISLLEGLEPNKFPPEEEWIQEELIFNIPIRLPLNQSWS